MDIINLDTPVLLIVWRRPKETIKVIDSLSKIKPKKIVFGSYFCLKVTKELALQT